MGKVALIFWWVALTPIGGKVPPTANPVVVQDPVQLFDSKEDCENELRSKRDSHHEDFILLEVCVHRGRRGLKLD